MDRGIQARVETRGEARGEARDRVEARQRQEEKALRRQVRAHEAIRAALATAAARLGASVSASAVELERPRDAAHGDVATNLALTVQARIRGQRGQAAPLPEGGYHGEYIREIAERYLAGHPEDPEGADLDAVRRFAVQQLREEQDRDLQALGVKFDVYFLESSLYATSKVEQTLGRLVTAGHTYEQDGALWLRTTDFGDDKDRVMRKRAEKGGDYTYFLPDVAYHVDKWERGFSRAINVQGADHHSTVTRVRIGLQALAMGIPTGYPEYVLHQMVTV